MEGCLPVYAVEQVQEAKVVGEGGELLSQGEAWPAIHKGKSRVK